MRTCTAMRVRLTKDFTFEAAQTLPKAPEGHKCRKVHGHSFKVEISVEGEADLATGWLYDHAEIGAAMKPLIQQLDHSYLNEIDGLENPTIENMAEGRGEAAHSLGTACIAALMAGIRCAAGGASIRSDLGSTRARVKRRPTALRWGLARPRGSNACS